MKANAGIKFGCLLIVTAIASLATPVHADTPAFYLEGTAAVQSQSFTGSRGWQFSIAGSSAITQLGVFDAGGDGLINPHQVGLWRIDGTLLASATVPAGTAAPLVDGYRYVSITPVVLGTFISGGIVAAQYSEGDADDQVTPHRGQLNGSVLESFGVGGRYALGSNLPFPILATPSPCPECAGPTFWESNFQFAIIPEPSVWLLLSPVLGYLFIRHRKARSPG